jgi:hypothetical protein
MIESSLVVCFALVSDPAPPFTFEKRVIDAKVAIGYGVAIGDLDRDAKPDVLLADAREFAWYKNGDWTRRTLHPALTARDNVAIAIHGNDIALGGDWAPNDTAVDGVAKYLAFGDTPGQHLLQYDFAAEPTVHRLDFVDIRGSKGDRERRGSEETALVIVPLHGRGNVDGAGEPVKVYAYLPVLQFLFDFEKELVDASMHRTHNFDVGQWNTATTQEEIVLIGAEGARICERANGAWTSRELKGVKGGGEIRMGRTKDGVRILATIEPMHGNVLALYREQGDGAFERREVDASLNQGHALALADLDGDGEPEIVCGWREKDARGETGIRVDSLDPARPPFALDGTIACEDLEVADLDGDGRLDIIAAGRASRDLVIYWNRTPRKS